MRRETTDLTKNESRMKEESMRFHCKSFGCLDDRSILAKRSTALLSLANLLLLVAMIRYD